MTNTDTTNTADLGGQHHTGSARIIADLDRQTDDLCHIHDHVTRVIANLDIDADWFTGYDNPNRANVEFDGVIRTFLYMHARANSRKVLSRVASVVQPTSTCDSVLTNPSNSKCSATTGGVDSGPANALR